MAITTKDIMRRIVGEMDSKGVMPEFITVSREEYEECREIVRNASALFPENYDRYAPMTMYGVRIKRTTV